MDVKWEVLGGSPGLVVKGGDSCSKGCGFKPQCRLLDGHNIFSHILVIRIVFGRFVEIHECR